MPKKNAGHQRLSLLFSLAIPSFPVLRPLQSVVAGTLPKNPSASRPVHPEMTESVTRGKPLPLSGTISRRFSHSSSLSKWDEAIMLADSKALARRFENGQITALLFDQI